MRQTRRKLLKTTGLALAGVTLAGCSSTSNSGKEDGKSEKRGKRGKKKDNGNNKGNGSEGKSGKDGNSESKNEEGGEAEDEKDSKGEKSKDGNDPNIAVAAQFNVLRSRIFDSVALGHVASAKASEVARGIFEDFEKSHGKWGVHEKLEKTSEEAYEGFEGALGELADALEKDEVQSAVEKADEASTHLFKAQKELVGDDAYVLDLQLIANRVANAQFLAEADEFKAGKKAGERVFSKFEKAEVHEKIEEKDKEAYEGLEKGMKKVIDGTEKEDTPTVEEGVWMTLDNAIKGSYSLGSETVVGAGHLASLQSRGYDASLLYSMGGPSKSYGHAGVLNTYRARIWDVEHLAMEGKKSNVARKIFAHFEGAEAHDPLEEKSAKAYEGFESGLKKLSNLDAAKKPEKVRELAGKIDKNLVDGMEALGGSPVLEASFFKSRIRDAELLYNHGKKERSVEIVENVFERFEKDELGFHEAFEHANHKKYEEFEKSLNSLTESMKNEKEVESVVDKILRLLTDAETMIGSTPEVSVGEASYMVSRAYDSACLAKLGKTEEASRVIKETFKHFEGGAGGFHEALEHASHENYESFEKSLGNVKDFETANSFNTQAVKAIYSVLDSGGSFSDEAASIAGDVFRDFEKAKVHEVLEKSDRGAYETFEKALREFGDALKKGEGVEKAVSRFSSATYRAEFAISGSVEKAPSLEGVEKGSEDEKEMKGGPNVVKGVPEDADHVIEMKAVSFDPSELRVKKDDKVAWKHADGEPHSVTAYDDKIPQDAKYFASGGFGSQKKAEKGWENGKGAISSGESYVHTFETAGEYEYYCIPHEAAGMKGKIIVEK